MFCIFLKCLLHVNMIRTQLQGDIVDTITHYENMPMQYTEIFIVVKNENFQ